MTSRKMTLREEFRKERSIGGGSTLEELMEDNNTNYIAWLETKIRLTRSTFAEKLSSSQIQLDAECAQIIADNFWELV